MVIITEGNNMSAGRTMLDVLKVIASQEMPSQICFQAYSGLILSLRASAS